MASLGPNGLRAQRWIGKIKSWLRGASGYHPLPVSYDFHSNLNMEKVIQNQWQPQKLRRKHFSQNCGCLWPCIGHVQADWWPISGLVHIRDWHLKSYCKISIRGAPNPNTQMILVSSCNCLCPIHWNQGSNQEWRCSWSSADRRCSNYIWVINKFTAYKGVSYIRGLTVTYEQSISNTLSEFSRLQLIEASTNGCYIVNTIVTSKILYLSIYISFGCISHVGLNGNDLAFGVVINWCWSSNKPLPAPMLTKICYIIWHHMAQLGHNELNTIRPKC